MSDQKLLPLQSERNVYICMYIYICIYIYISLSMCVSVCIYVVESKLGPHLGGSWVKTWPPMFCLFSQFYSLGVFVKSQIVCRGAKNISLQDLGGVKKGAFLVVVFLCWREKRRTEKKKQNSVLGLVVHNFFLKWHFLEK